MNLIPCLSIEEGQRFACERPQSNQYFQLAVLYPNIPVLTDFNEGYKGDFVLNKEIKRLVFEAPANTRAIKGEFEKKEDKFGYAEYEHRITLLLNAFTEKEKKQLHYLDNHVFKAVLFKKDRTAEIFGVHFGLKSADYTFGNKAEIVELKSLRTESVMPVFYRGETLGEELILDDAFQIFDKTFDKTFE